MAAIEKPRVGFVGLGMMGSGMAKNILAGGYELSVVGHVNRSAVDALAARGASDAGCLARLGATCDIVFLCLPSSRQVESVVLGPSGLLALLYGSPSDRPMELLHPRPERRIEFKIAAGRSGWHLERNQSEDRQRRRQHTQPELTSNICLAKREARLEPRCERPSQRLTFTTRY